MELENSFVVPSDIESAWNTLLDLERVAPCLPGASLDHAEGGEFSGSVKVKLGPVSMTYGGVAKFLERDDASHTAVIEGSAKETRGGGTAKALIHTRLLAEAPDRTRVEVTTDLTITGKAAQFGRGVMQDVAGRIIDTFAANLAELMSAQEAPAEADATAAPSAPKADSINLLEAAGAPVAKRLVPVVLVVAVVGVIVWLSVRRR